MHDHRNGSTRFSRCHSRLSVMVWLAAAAIVLIVAGNAHAQTCVPHWDGGAQAASLRIRAMTLFDDGTGETVWAVRDAFGSTPAALLKWNPATRSWTTVTTINVAGSLTTMAVFNNSIYIAGAFSAIDGAPFGSIARWTGSGWSNVANGVSGPPFGFEFGTASINTMYVWDDGTGPALYVGGGFQKAGVISALNIARWNGLNWHNLGSGTEGGAAGGGTVWGTVNSLMSFDDGTGDALYVGGAFHSAGGIASPHLARWRLGEGWSAVGGLGTFPGWCCPTVLSLAVFNDGSGNALYAGGWFQFAGGQFVSSIARWDGSSWSPVGGPLLNDGFDDWIFINSMAVFNDGDGNALYIAGEFDDADGLLVGHVARWDGSSWSGPPAVIDENVNRIHPFLGDGQPMLLVATFRDFFLWVGCTGDIDADTSEVEVTTSIISAFGGLTTVIVTPRDSTGEIAPAGSVVFNTTAGEMVGPVIDLGDGRFAQDLVAEPNASGAIVSAIVDGVAITDTAEVTFVAVDPLNSTVHVSLAQTFLGGQATVTVTLRDDNNVPVHTPHNVVITTTRGEMLGSVSSPGFGQYTQTIIASQIGTAAISATADGLPLHSSASLAILDPGLFGNVIGEDEHGNFFAFMAIQTAINAADILDLRTIFVAPGEYAETILVEDREDLTIEALSAEEPVVIQGVIFSQSSNVSLRYFDIDASDAKKDAVTLRGQKNANTGVELLGLLITGAQWNGIAVEVDNEDTSIVDCVIHGNARNGILFERTGGPYLVDGCEIFDNGHNGVYIGREVEVTLSHNLIYENGTANGQGGGRYGIFRERQPQSGSPDQVTLISNEIHDNNGRTQPNRSDENVGNFDQIIDETDDQPPYTGDGEE